MTTLSAARKWPLTIRRAYKSVIPGLWHLIELHTWDFGLPRVV